MPEFNTEEREPADFVRSFEEFLRNAPDDLSLQDIDNMQVVLLCRLRSLMTVDQLHAREHLLIQKAENALRTPGAFVDDEGNPAQPLVVENFQGDAEDYRAMLSQVGEDVSDDELEALLNEGEEE